MIFFSSKSDSEHPLHLTLEKTLYVRFEGDNLAFSSDLQDWKPIEEFFSGSFGTSLGVVDGKQEMSFFSEILERGLILKVAYQL